MNAPDKRPPPPAENDEVAELGNGKKSKSSLRPEDLKWDAEAELLNQSELLANQAAVAIEPQTSTQEPRPDPLVIDKNVLEKRGFIVPNGARSATIQEFRGVKRSLLLNAMPSSEDGDDLGRLIMITSALPGEGKTFCAVNLALSLVEEQDYSVLLVDGDVAKPSIPEVLELAQQPGLIDALADPGTDVRSLIHETSIPKLSYLSAGRAHHQATELLASSLMQDLLDTIMSIDSKQIVVFDSPPLLVSTEAPGLPPRMGQIVLVVEIGKTKRSAVKDALTIIDRDDDSVTILLNKASHGRSASGYGGYGYGYGYGRKD
ncbi:MAG: P-loop NTPase [Burkholderiaceae bacterium]